MVFHSLERSIPNGESAGVSTAKPTGLHLPTEQPAAGRVRLWAVTVVNPNIIPSLLANRGLIMLDGK